MKQVRFQWVALAIAAVLWVCTGATHAFGQATNTGTVVGEVSDPTGALIAGASVTLTNASTGTTNKAVTNGEGKYVFTAVPIGTYDLTTTKSGFSTAKTTGLVVSVGTQTTANIKMAVGGGTQTVEVQVMGTELQTLNSTVGQTISQEAINSLPSLNHDVNTFTEMQPGVSPDGSVAGTVVDQSTFLLDGGNNTNDMDGSMSVYTGSFAGDPTGGVSNQSPGVAAGPTGVLPTPADSIEEFKVNTANQTADFNNSSGAQVELVTPRGTNRWHGGVYEYYLDNNFDANTWDNNNSGTPLTSYHYSRFGAKAGGFFLPSLLGGRWYAFGFFEGYRFPNSTTIERAVPSAAMESGMITIGGTTYDMKTVDPRGIGINPTVQQMWTKYMPTGNDPSCGGLFGSRCDGVNEIGFKANLSEPTTSNNVAARVDHDFNAKWHWFASYRYFKEEKTTNSQVDIGGFFSGDKLGVPSALSHRPQQPWYFVTGLTTSLTPSLTNDFHYSFLRNFWSWADQNAPPQIAGLGGALEPFGESSTTVLAPYNVNTQSIRTRFWDGQDHFISDNMSLLKGNHLLQWGGQYQHNFNYHQRSDNGGGINFTTTYQLGDSKGAGSMDLSDLGGGYPQTSTALRDAAAVLGIVTDSQVAYTRVGTNLALQPPLTHAYDKSVIPFYNVYFSDTWHMKPSFTLSYGMGWTLEMPPYEAQGKQTDLVDTADEPVVVEDFLAQRKAAAEQGQVFNPELGFALVGNVGKGQKYPYNPFYGSFSPRLGFAWNPSFSKSTVIRGGYGRIYGRLNGVDLVLVPLLGVGLIQPVQCQQALASGACGPATPTATTAFRIGVDGNAAPLPTASPTLPQPTYPGHNAIAGSAQEAMDPGFRPNSVDSIDLTIQRQIGQKALLEVGYIGRIIHHEYLPVNLNNVPYMMSVGGQQFQNAYATIEKFLGCATSTVACGANVPASGTAAYTSYINSVAAQPFFEAALAGTGYCNGYSSCTAAVLDKEMSSFNQQQVYSIWSDLDNGGFNTTVIPRSMEQTPLPGTFGASGEYSSGVADNASIGYGNYNGAFISFGTRDWHGLTMQHNFTWSKALGTAAQVQATSEFTPNDPYNLGALYGVQAFDRRLVYNAYVVAQDPWFKGQHGFLGRVAGGWTLAPVFVAGSGAPDVCAPSSGTQAQAWGAGDGNNYFDQENCIFTKGYSAGHSRHLVGGSYNMFPDPTGEYDTVRTPILGIDTKDGGFGAITGLPYWNMDAQLKKDVRIAESAVFEFSFITTNVFNHMVFNDPSLDSSNPGSFGSLTTQGNSPRKMEFGLRVDF